MFVIIRFGPNVKLSRQLCVPMQKASHEISELRYKLLGNSEHSRIVSHDVAHVHLDCELFQVDGKHHQSLPRCPLLTGCLTILTARGS